MKEELKVASAFYETELPTIKTLTPRSKPYDRDTSE